ncbi:MAG: hypothetical protein GX861_03955 [Tenericutes bacterium]|jgi:hypothetical protein|nr:hypothetical protein [Mycoplasmatota bacterium]
MTKKQNIMLLGAASLMIISYSAWCVYKHMSKKASNIIEEVCQGNLIPDELD